MHYLDSITDPEQAVDLVSCAVLPGAVERQAILETVDVEARLRRLIHFLLAEIRPNAKVMVMNDPHVSEDIRPSAGVPRR
jgi:hypothetical protein